MDHPHLTTRASAFSFGPAIKAKAALEQKSLDQIIKQLLREWVKESAK